MNVKCKAYLVSGREREKRGCVCVCLCLCFYLMVPSQTIDLYLRTSYSKTEIVEGISAVGLKVIANIWSPGKNKNFSIRNKYKYS